MPGRNWAMNLFTPAKLTEEQMADIPYPRWELHTHVTMKMVEAGIIVGVVIFAPISTLIRKKPFMASLYRSSRIGAMFGLVTGPIMTEARIKDATPDAIYDRSYRLRHNRDQVRVDRSVSYGALGGAALSSFAGNGVGPGLVAGIGLSCVGAGIYNNFVLKKDDTKKKEESKKDESKKDNTSPS